MPSLPDFIPPMLCASGDPFDSDEHLFEIKWDGMRTLCFAEGGSYRLINRQRNDCLNRYPELGFLADLPAGTALDGELVLLRDGRPSFRDLMGRQHMSDARRIATKAEADPVVFVVFDVMYQGFQPLMKVPLVDRRKLLQEMVGLVGNERLTFFEGVVGNGLEFFGQMQKQKFEGMVAKRLDSRYLPGQRTDAWTKIKQAHYLHCLILGYKTAEDDPRDLRSLIIATDDAEGGGLRCIGRVGSGLSDALRAELFELLSKRQRSDPLIPCDDRGVWVEPGVYCTVSYLEKSKQGLRAPVFVELIKD